MTISNAFHLHNAGTRDEQNATLNGQHVTHHPHPATLGVALDRTLSNKEHQEETAAKFKMRNALLMKLTGSAFLL